MNIWNGIERYPADSPRVVASIGNYDGVHRGHRVVLDHVVAEARRLGLPALLITFDPHPLGVVDPRRRPRLLLSRRQKLELLEQAGLSDVLIVRFSPEVVALEARAFFTGLLGERVRFEAVYVGENFRFGRGRAGNLGLLEELGRELGFRVRGFEAVRVAGEVVSSTAVRTALAEGDVERAQAMLGRPFALTGTIVRGSARGREMHSPTANLEPENDLILRPGVYVTESLILAARHPSVTNVGMRPTFGGGKLTVESHLLEFAGDLYGHPMELRFLARLRDEMRFADRNALADQIARDRAAATAYFQHLPLRS